MAGDLGIRERVVILPDTRALGAAPALETNASRRVVHMYGNRASWSWKNRRDDVRRAGRVDGGVAAVLQSFSEEERLGYDAYCCGSRPTTSRQKAARPLDGESWDAGDGMSCTPPEATGSTSMASRGQGVAPTSQRLTGSVAVGIVIVEGPNANLKFSAAERTKVVAEVQNGLSWLATQNPEGIVFKSRHQDRDLERAARAQHAHLRAEGESLA